MQALSEFCAHKPYYSRLIYYVNSRMSDEKNEGSFFAAQEFIYGLQKLVLSPTLSPEREEKYVMMIARTALEKLPLIRNSSSIPATTKEILTKENVFDTYVAMANCSYSEEFVGLVKDFEFVSTNIAVSLAKRGDPKSRHWNVRKPELWDWCRVLINDTAHPIYFKLLEERDSYGPVLEKFDRLFETLVKTVIWVSSPDDLADNYKHVELTRVFNKIPFSDEGTLKSLEEQVCGIDGGLFNEYFKLTVKVWKSVEKDFKELLGESYQTYLPELKKDYLSITRAMELSAQMNSTPMGISRTNTGYEQQLQHNMMANSFNTIQTIFLHELNRTGEISIDFKLFDSSVNGEFESIRRVAQENARRSNNLATFGRGLDEFDTSNILFHKLNRWYKTPSNFIRYQERLLPVLQQLQRESFSQTSSNTDQIQVENFFSLMLLRNLVENALYVEYKKVDSQNKLLQFPTNFLKAAHEIEQDCVSLPDSIPFLKKISKELVQIMKDIAKESQVFQSYYSEWEDAKRFLYDQAASYFDNSSYLLSYLSGWDKVHVTYLAMKYEPIF